jgi:hypothetical protein
VDVSTSNSDISNNPSNNAPNKSSSDSPKDNYVKKEDVIVTSTEVLDKVGDVVTTMVKDAVACLRCNH